MRIAKIWLIDLMVPALATTVWELVHQILTPGATDHGLALVLLGMYSAGVVAGNAISWSLSRGIATAIGVAMLTLGMPLGVASASLGILAVVLPVVGLSSIFAALLYRLTDP